MRKIESMIDIAASAARVWAVLIAFDEYPTWNPFITRITGRPQETSRLRVHIEPPGRSGMTFKPTVVRVDPGWQLVWLGHFLLPGLLDGQHELCIEARGEQCRFHQSEEFRGLLVPIFGLGMLEATRRGFEAMNAALKRRAEASSVERA
jgi:hypothetical protein